MQGGLKHLGGMAGVLSHEVRLTSEPLVFARYVAVLPPRLVLPPSEEIAACKEALTILEEWQG